MVPEYNIREETSPLHLRYWHHHCQQNLPDRLWYILICIPVPIGCLSKKKQLRQTAYGFAYMVNFFNPTWEISLRRIFTPKYDERWYTVRVRDMPLLGLWLGLRLRLWLGLGLILLTTWRKNATIKENVSWKSTQYVKLFSKFYKIQRCTGPSILFRMCVRVEKASSIAFYRYLCCMSADDIAWERIGTHKGQE